MVTSERARENGKQSATGPDDKLLMYTGGFRRLATTYYTTLQTDYRPIFGSLVLSAPEEELAIQPTISGDRLPYFGSSAPVLHQWVSPLFMSQRKLKALFLGVSLSALLSILGLSLCLSSSRHPSTLLINSFECPVSPSFMLRLEQRSTFFLQQRRPPSCPLRCKSSDRYPMNVTSDRVQVMQRAHHRRRKPERR
jgi:hypothetical protein